MSPSDLPQGTSGWIVLAAFVIVGLTYLGRFLAEMSETWAKLLGPLGKRWHARGQRRQAARAEIVEQIPLRLETAEADRDFYRARARRAEKQHEQFIEWYQKVDQPFHRNLRINAAEAGCELPPDWEPLSEWARREDSKR